MVKRLKKSPEDGELQTPTEGEVVFPAGDGWDAQQQATVTAYAQSRGMQPREVLQALVNSMEKTLRKEKESNPASQIPPSGVKQKGEAAGKLKLGPAPEEGEGTRERRNQMPDASRVIETEGEMCPRRPDGRKSRKKRPVTWGRLAKKIWP